MTCDYTGQFFSLKNGAPELLPPRVRLSNGLTRYTNCITRKELLSLGYIGPIEVPSVTETQTYWWNTEISQFSVRDKTEEEINCPTDSAIRYSLQKILEKKHINMSKNLLDKPRENLNKYYEQVDALLASDKILTCSDIPSLDLWDGFTTQTEFNTYIESVEPTWKYEYEVLGASPWTLDIHASGFYSPPSDWVASGTI